MTGPGLRFFRMSAALKNALRRLGKVRPAICRRRCAAPGWSAWLADPARSGGGVFDLLIHDADMALHLFGPPEAVSATGYEALAAGIDVIPATLPYPRGIASSTTGGCPHPGTTPLPISYP